MKTWAIPFILVELGVGDGDDDGVLGVVDVDDSVA
jgi:hypothetical protein